MYVSLHCSSELLLCCVSHLPTCCFSLPSGNVFSGILSNRLFIGILVSTSILQAIIVEFGSIAFSVHEDGLEPKFWALSLVLGSMSLVVQQVINLFYRCGQRYNIYKNKKRTLKYGHLTLQKIDATGSAEQHAHSD